MAAGLGSGRHRITPESRGKRAEGLAAGNLKPPLHTGTLLTGGGSNQFILETRGLQPASTSRVPLFIQ